MANTVKNRRPTLPHGSSKNLLTDEKLAGWLEEAERAHREEIGAISDDRTMMPSSLPPAYSGPLSDTEVVQFQRLLHERIRRRYETLRLYRPLPYQATFHESDAPERSLRASNRAGKTLSAAIEVGRAVTGQDPFGKFPKTGRCIIVGQKEQQLGEVLYRKLFKPGSMRIIRDAVTREWRTYAPNVDYERRKETKQAPPIIPRRFYDPRQITWFKKKEEVPRKIVLNSGWEMYFFSSLGQAPQGWDVDLVWFDEEIEHPSWYGEMAARLIDRAEWDEEKDRWIGGKFLWSATPQAGTVRLYEISQTAIQEKEDHPEGPRVEEFTATLFDNSYLSERSKQLFIDKMEGSEDEKRVRVYGEFALLGLRIYSEFAPRGAHGCDSFVIPDDWCRYCSIDPGRQVCAVLFAAVPPRNWKHPNQVYLYDELYIRRCDSERFAELFAGKVAQNPIHEALIDHHCSRVTEIGSGKTVEEQYKAALEKRKIKFTRGNGVHFTWGSDDVEARILAVKAGLHVVDGHSTRWMVFRDKCPNFIKEAQHYCNAKDMKTGIPLDKPLKINDHQMDNWGYLAMHKLPYAKPKLRKQRGNYAFEALRAKQTRMKGQHGSGIQIG